MATLIIEAARRTLDAFGRTMPCAVGRSGFCAADAKHEGDGRTPLGRWPIRGALLRRDRVALKQPPRIAWRWLRRTDGWSDDPGDPEYNRPVTHPHAFRAESLWRADMAYDAIVVLGHNDLPPLPGLGSAIFLHMVTESAVTAGCIAVARNDLLGLIGEVRDGDVLEICPG